MSKARALPKASTWTEWSITRSTGTSGLIFAGSEPSSSIASRIAARSTIAGTPVKSCISTRAGWNGISSTGSAFASQEAIVSTSSAVTELAVLEPQHVLEQDLERVGQPGDVELLLQRVEPVDLVLACRRPSRCRLAPRSCRSWLRVFPIAAAERPPTPASACRSGPRRSRRRPWSPRCRATRPASSGALTAIRDASALAQRRDRDLAAVALDRARRRRRPTCSGVPVPIRPAALGAASRRTCRRRGSRPGRTPRRRPPCPRRSSRRQSAKPRRPNLVAAVERGARRSRPCPRARRRRRGGPRRARQRRAQLARHPHRRLEVDPQRAADLLLGEAVEPAGGGQRRRWRPGRRSRRPRRAAAAPRPPRRGRRRPCGGRRRAATRRARSSSSPLRELSTSVAPRAGERLGDRPAEAAGRAGQQHGLAARGPRAATYHRIGWRAMKLYICWGTFQTPRPGGHPCATPTRRCGRRLRPRGVKVHGLGVGPSFLHLKTDGRKEVEELTGSPTVPVWSPTRAR